MVLIESYGRVDLPITRPDGTKSILRIKKAAYCPSFAVNIVSFYILYDQGIRWNTMVTPTQLVHKSGNKICTINVSFLNGSYTISLSRNRVLMRHSRSKRVNKPKTFAAKNVSNNADQDQYQETQSQTRLQMDFYGIID